MTSSRSSIVKQLSVLLGLIALLLSLHAMLCEWPIMCRGNRMCGERVSLLFSSALSAWCTMGALGVSARVMTPCNRCRSGVLALCSACGTTPKWFLLRSLLCGGAVALLGWSMLLGRSHWLLMAAMQANAAVGAWLVCEVSHTERAKPTQALRRVSMTLPRGWRYHRSTGLFEHKRTGRMQSMPPATGETGSPMCHLPPCDEEQGSASDSYEDVKVRHGRSRTWNDGSRSAGSRKEPNKERASGNGMNVWELRSALGANGNADDAV